MLAVRGEKAEEIERWVLENGFEERTKGRGLLIRGWAPQVLILSHPAIGGFLTRCGWNSTLEGVCAGVPMVTWPMFTDQYFNEKLVVQILKTGLSVGSKVGRHAWEEEEKPESWVSRLEIQKAVNRVMDEDDEDANERRKRAKEVAGIAKKAVEEGGSSHLNVSLLIQDIMQLASNANYGGTQASDDY